MKIARIFGTFPISWNRSSFRTKMVISILGVVSLSLIIVLSTYYHRMSEVVENNTYRSLEEMTSQSVSTIELHLENIRNQAWDFFSDEAVQEFVGSMRESDFDTRLYYRGKLSQIVRNNSLVRSITLHNLDGMDVRNDGHINRFERERHILIQSALERDGIGAWEITRTASSLYDPPINFTLSYTQALKNITFYQQTKIGVVRIDMDIRPLQNILQALKMDYDGQFYIVDQQGVIMLSENSAQLGQSLAEDSWFRSYDGFSSHVGRFVVQLDGKRWISLHHKFESTDWYIIGKIPLDEVLVSVNQVRDQTLFIGLISLAIALILAYGVALSVTLPLKTLQRNMEQIKMGKWDASIQVTSRDEIGYLQETFNQMSKKIHTLITRVYKTELLKKEAEIKALQSQINPHFLYNALGTIDSFASIQGDKRISSISQALAGMFRYSISGGNIATVQEEIEQIRMYLLIQQIRYPDRLHYEIEVDPALNEVYIPKLLLQPLVENAWTHGIELKRGSSTIRISVKSLGLQEMEITIEDNGVGMSAERLREVRLSMNSAADQEDDGLYESPNRHGGTSIGLANVNQRIKLFYDGKSRIDITSKKDEGTIVRLVLAQVMNGGDPHA